jgi:inositol phosphorylceramide mannosyltransferase catalytic subunit
MTSSSLRNTYVRRIVRIWQGLRAGSSYAMLYQVLLSKLFRRAPAATGDASRVQPSEVDTARLPRTVPRTATADGGIPKIIFQTWKTRDRLPTNYRYWSATFRTHNPQHDYVLWDDADNREFIREDFPWFLPYYDGYPREIFRADIVRLFFLFRFGGLYADLDTECLRPLDSVLTGAQLVLGRMGEDTQFAHSVPNAMMASAPRQLFWLLAVAMAIERIRECGGSDGMRARGPEDLTGPILVKNAYDYYTASSETAVRERAAWVLQQVHDPASVVAGKILLLGPSAWYPLDWNNAVHDLFRREMLSKRFIPNAKLARQLFPESSLVTYWTHSW